MRHAAIVSPPFSSSALQFSLAMPQVPRFAWLYSPPWLEGRGVAGGIVGRAARSPGNHVDAETCFHHALDVARYQHAKSWELRTATGLARLWQQQGKRAVAHGLLAPVYHWFTEGFDTIDLRAATDLLEELAEA